MWKYKILTRSRWWFQFVINSFTTIIKTFERLRPLKDWPVLINASHQHNQPVYRMVHRKSTGCDYVQNKNRQYYEYKTNKSYCNGCQSYKYPALLKKFKLHAYKIQFKILQNRKNWTYCWSFFLSENLTSDIYLALLQRAIDSALTIILLP